MQQERLPCRSELKDLNHGSSLAHADPEQHPSEGPCCAKALWQMKLACWRKGRPSTAGTGTFRKWVMGQIRKGLSHAGEFGFFIPSSDGKLS